MPEFGLECKAPWCQRILNGDKTIELRRYELPPDFIGRRIWLLATTGAENVPSLGDIVPAGSDAAEIVSFDNGVPRRCNVHSLCSMTSYRVHYALETCMEVGSVVFSGVKEYSSMDSWSTDAGRHLVPKDSPYAFREGEGRAYGWIVQDSTRLAQPMPVPQMKRLLRSIYEMST